MANDPETTEPVVLVGWDESERSRDALVLAGVLARAYDLRVRVAYVYEIYSSYPFVGEMLEVIREEAARRMHDLPEELLGGVEYEKRVVPGTSPAEGLTREAEHCGARIVVVGSTHRGTVGRVLPGSTAQHLLHGAPCAVAVAPSGYAEPAPERLAVVAAAFDTGPESRAAVERAVELARRVGATVRVITSVPPFNATWVPAAAYAAGELQQTERTYYRDQLAQLVAELPSDVRAQDRLRDGEAAHEIVDECEAGVDLLVMGSRGYGTVRRALLGSVSADVVKSAPCPVLVIPRSEAAEAKPESSAAEATA